MRVISVGLCMGFISRIEIDTLDHIMLLDTCRSTYALHSYLPLQFNLDPMEQLRLLPQLLRGGRSPALAIIAKRCETLIREWCWCCRYTMCLFDAILREGKRIAGKLRLCEQDSVCRIHGDIAVEVVQWGEEEA
jgi:hypothetical protein